MMDCKFDGYSAQYSVRSTPLCQQRNKSAVNP